MIRLGWINRLPAWVWLALPVAAMAPVWIWSAARLTDQSDDPLGVIALIALGIVLVRDHRCFCNAPRLNWLIGAAFLAATAILGSTAIAPLIRGVLAILAVCSAMVAVRMPAQPMLALCGLALLALPLLSSLQFFAGFPLRVITAEVSRLLLVVSGIDAQRDGSTLVVAGRMVMVDAPCSGIQMGWMAYFTACAAAAWLRIPDRAFLRRIPLIGITVLLGNIVRNTLLVAKEAGVLQWPDWTHEGVGIAAFAVVCILVLRNIAHAAEPVVLQQKTHSRQYPVEVTIAERSGRLLVLMVFGCLIAWPWLHSQQAASSTNQAIEWPQQFEGRFLRPLALSQVEERFADRFPGSIARFSDGERTVVLRHVNAPTRMLHPAADCYRGLGYKIASDTLEQERNNDDSQSPKLWRCFIAEKNGQRQRVCEQIVDATGKSFTDTSSWYWAAVTGRSQGPWKAVTKAEGI